MGNYLTYVHSAKESAVGATGRVSLGTSSMQGWRVSMEDAHLIYSGDLDEELYRKLGLRFFERKNYSDRLSNPRIHIFGVYDGHGGGQVAKFCAANIVRELLNSSPFKEGSLEIALRVTYCNLDRILKSEKWLSTQYGGDGSPYFDQNPDSCYVACPGDDFKCKPSAYICPNKTAAARSHSDSKTLQLLYESSICSKCKCTLPKIATKSFSRQNSQSSQNNIQKEEKDKDNEKSTAETQSDSEPQPINNINKINNNINKINNNNINSSPTNLDTNKNEDLIINSPDISSTATGESSSCESDSSLSPKDILTTSPSALPQPGFMGSAYKLMRSTITGVSAVAGKISTFIPGVQSPGAKMANVGSVGLERAHGANPALYVGCTALTVVLIDNVLYVANAGDSRAVLCRGGRAEPLSVDHKPMTTTERSRIYSAGGFVEYGRINGNLNLSRAIGDLIYKQDPNLPCERQILSCYPDVMRVELTEEDEFLIMGCDGIWEFFKSQDVVDYIRYRMNPGDDQFRRLSSLGNESSVCGEDSSNICEGIISTSDFKESSENESEDNLQNNNSQNNNLQNNILQNNNLQNNILQKGDDEDSLDGQQLTSSSQNKKSDSQILTNKKTLIDPSSLTKPAPSKSTVSNSKMQIRNDATVKPLAKIMKTPNVSLNASSLEDILEGLFDSLVSPNPAIFEYGCDNMTAILVDLRPGHSCSCGCHDAERNEVSLSLHGHLPQDNETMSQNENGVVDEHKEDPSETQLSPPSTTADAPITIDENDSILVQ